MSTARPDIVTPEQWRAARAALLERRRRTHVRATPLRPRAAACR